MPVYTAHESITVSSTAIGGTAATIANKHHAVITVETAQIRYTVDGTTPTATVGHIADDGNVIKLESADEVQKFRAIRTGADATLKASYGVA